MAMARMRNLHALFRRLVAPVVLLLLTFGTTPTPAAAQTLGIAAVVNDEVISLYDLEARMRLLIITSNQQDTPEVRQRLARQVLNRLIDEKLKLQEAKRLGIKVPKKDLDRAFANMERRNKLPKGGLAAFLKQNRLDRVVLMEQLEASLAWAAAVNRTYRSRVTISEEEIDDVINEIKASKGQPEFLASEIFLAVSNPNLAGEVLGNANRLIDQILKGANFNALARHYSQSSSASSGGNLGWVRQGQMANKIGEALARMNKGDLSKPIRTVAGYHIILKRNQRIGTGLPSSDETLDLRQVFLPLPPNATDGNVTAVKGKAREMASGAKGCPAMVKLAAESGSPLSGSLGEVKASSLPAPIQAVLKDLPVGTASAPVASNGGIVFLMVCKRSGGGDLETVRDNIRKRLLGDRLDISARGYLRDLRQTAFLDIRI